MFDLKIIEKFYSSFPAKVDNARSMLGRPLTSDDFGHSEYDVRKEELTNKRLFAKLPPMVDYHELIGYVKHTGLPWEILTAAGAINRNIVVYDKNEWIKQYVDPYVVVTCSNSNPSKGSLFSFIPDFSL